MSKVLHVVTNVDHFDDEATTPTGLWASELIHVYDKLAEAGVEQVIASPAGGATPIEPRSLLPLVADSSVKRRLAEPGFKAQLDNTVALADVAAGDFDAIYLTGGHGVMYDFPNSADLQRLIREIYENGRLVGAVCHGYAGFENVTLSDGTPFVQGKKLTGFSWLEEMAAGVSKKVPYNVEEKIKGLGATYSKLPVPMAPHVVQDGRLITGQNPTSAKGVGTALVNALRVLRGE